MASEYELALRDAANRACDLCAEYASQRLNSLRGGRMAFYPNVDVDECKFSVGVVDEHHYLVYQDTGFRTFAMKELRGKVVPMLIDGQRVFRRAVGVNEFRPGTKTYWFRGVDGELFPRQLQRRAWVHPGLPSKDFIRDGVRDAAVERANDIYAALMRDMRNERR